MLVPMRPVKRQALHPREAHEFWRAVGRGTGCKHIGRPAEGRGNVPHVSGSERADYFGRPDGSTGATVGDSSSRNKLPFANLPEDQNLYSRSSSETMPTGISGIMTGGLPFP